MSDNLKYWNQLAEVPKWALREITSGRLRGKSDINPQWRLEAMTQTFGPCGQGWKYVIDKTWTEPGPDGQVMVFVQVSVRVKIDGAWSDSVPGIGGSMLVSKESRGLHASDEGYKMALTDALSVAMKALGVAAKVYEGLWDGSKYKDIGKGQGPGNSPSRTEESNPEQVEVFEEEVKSLKTYEQVCQVMTRAKNNLAQGDYAKVRKAAMDQLDLINEAALTGWSAYLADLSNANNLKALSEEELVKAAGLIKKLAPVVQKKLQANFKDKLPGLFS